MLTKRDVVVPAAWGKSEAASRHSQAQAEQRAEQTALQGLQGGGARRGGRAQLADTLAQDLVLRLENRAIVEHRLHGRVITVAVEEQGHAQPSSSPSSSTAQCRMFSARRSA